MVDQTILRTKLYAPPPRRNLVAPPRLLAKLDASLAPENRLTLVSAPAGFGKTTLVSDWVSKTRASGSVSAQAIAWFTLDEADNDYIRFWRYLLAALQTIDSRLGESILPALYTPQPPAYQTMVTGLVDELIMLPTNLLYLACSTPSETWACL